VGQAKDKHKWSVPYRRSQLFSRTIELFAAVTTLAALERNIESDKAYPVADQDYCNHLARRAPVARADGIVVFDRPTFKESRENYCGPGCKPGEIEPVRSPGRLCVCGLTVLGGAK